MSRSPHLGRWATLALGLANATCLAVLGMDSLSERSPVGDGGARDDGSVEAGACNVDDIGLPGRPADSDAAVEAGDSAAARDAGGSVIFALRELDLGLHPERPRVGFDLDHAITTDVSTNRCVFHDAGDPEVTLRFGADPSNGVDNLAFTLMEQLGYFTVSLRPENINQRLVEGRFGLALQLDGWNHGRNDGSVDVKILPLIGYWLRPADGGLIPAGDHGGKAAPDAGDLWMPDERFMAGRTSNLLSSRAWITDGKLVARFNTLTLPIRSSNAELKPLDIILDDAWIVASIVPPGDDARPSLEDGVIAGRVRVPALLREMGHLYDDDSQPNGYVCVGNGTLPRFVAAAACSVRDIRSSHCDDGKSLPCDAISFGAGFRAYSVNELGPFRGRADAEYYDAGRLPPRERCPDAAASLFECPP